MEYNHFISRESTDIVATGGKGDREIFVYEATKSGKLTKLHCFRGHTGKCYASLKILC